MIEAVVFDIDNTLTNDVSWLRITELTGASVAEHEDIFQRMRAHELPYEAAKQQLLQLWQDTGNANKAFWSEMFADWPLKDGAAELVQHTMEQGYKTALITGSVDLFAEAVARKLHIAAWYANTTLVWDEQDQLIDFRYVQDQAAQKVVDLQKFVLAAGVALNGCVIIGDGDNDLETFKATGRGIAVNSHSSALLEASWKQTAGLDEIPALLESAE